MKLQNLTLATAILLALTGCGSSGGGSGAPQNKPTVQDEQTQKQVDDAKKAKEAAEQKAEEAQKAQAAAEQNAEKAHQAQAAAEKKALEAQEAKTAAEQNAEKARQAQTVAEQKATDAQKAQAAAEQKAEAARQAQIAAEKKVKEAEEAQAAAEQKAQNVTEQSTEELHKAQAVAKQKTEEARQAQADAKKAHQAQLAAEKNAEDAKKAQLTAEKNAEDAQKAKEIAENNAEIARQAQTEAEQKVKAAQDALAAEQQKVKEAQDALATEREKIKEAQQAEKARASKYQELFDLARGFGLDKGTSHEFANANLNTAQSELSSALDKAIEQEIDNIKGISSASYSKGKVISEDIYGVTETDKDYTVKKVQRKMLYNQKYSATIADYYVQETYDKNSGNLADFNTVMANIRTQGLKTQVANLPKEGSATYSGKAFHGLVNTTLPQSEGSNSSKEVKASGNMSYTVNFAYKTGSGKIIGLGDQIILERGEISGAGISSTAKQDNISGSYSLEFFGKEAEEIGGKVSFDQKDSLSFGGSRGEIKK